MSKLIAVWGSPDSGKTSFAVKLASAVYERYNSTVLVLACDHSAPVLPQLFPTLKSEELYSVGAALSQTDITQESVINSIVTLKGKINLGYLGYKDGENRYTYPAYGENKARELLAVLKSLADFVVVDCTSNLDNLLAATAVKEADQVIRLATPTLKSISFFASQLLLYADPIYKLESHILGLNCTEADCYMPVEDAKAHFKNIAFTLPYCREIRQQTIDGKLPEPVHDKKYAAKFRAIVDKVV